MSTQEQEIVETTEEPRVRREVSGRQVGIIVGVLVLVLLLFWFFFLRGGGGGEDETATPQVPVTQPPPPTEPPDEKQPPGDRAGKKGPVETFEVFAPRDPFEPLIDLTQGGGTDAGDTEGETGDGEDAGDGTDTDGDGDIDSEDGSPTDTGDSENVEGHAVELVATLEDGAVQIRVDDTVYTVEEGENFAQNFQLVSVSDNCATVLYGDDQFSICEGQEILK